MTSEPGLKLADVALLTAVALIWGLNFVVIALGLKGFPPLLFSALRFLVCAFPVIFFVPKPKVGWWSLLAVGIVLGTLVFAFLFVGINMGMAAGLSSLVMQMQVFFTVILGVVMLKERPLPLNWFAVLLGLAGIAMIAVERAENGGIAAFAVVLAGALSWGFANILLKTLPKVNMMHLMVWMSLVPPLPLLILSGLFEGWDRMQSAVVQTTWLGVGAILYTGLLSTVLAYGIWGRMLQRHTTTAVAPFALLTPVFGLVSASIFLGERYSGAEAIASILVVAALGLNIWAAPLHGRISAMAHSRL